MNEMRRCQVVRHSRPTMIFIGVTTGDSSINHIFPKWAKILGLDDAQLVGVDLSLNAPPEQYRAVVTQIKQDSFTLGALVTTHKIDLFAATRDLFDELDAYARLAEEVSCICKRNGLLRGEAQDPITAGRSIEQMVVDGYWAETEASVICIGAGGAGTAIMIYFGLLREEGDRPRQFYLIDRDEARLQKARTLLQKMGPTELDVRLRLHERAVQNDRLMEMLPAGSLVINATGMGKDIPGSPLTAAARFPRRGIAWELNYRGPRRFYHQALAQAAKRELTVHDGWTYFLLGWSNVIAGVFQLEIAPRQFARLAEAAETIR
jgi:shikimate dehydrogenase